MQHLESSLRDHRHQGLLVSEHNLILYAARIASIFSTPFDCVLFVNAEPAAVHINLPRPLS
jgi:hypothetical protein